MVALWRAARPHLTWRNAGLLVAFVIFVVCAHLMADAMTHWLTTHIEPSLVQQSIFDQFMRQQAQP